jgi:hypothetical protein
VADLKSSPAVASVNQHQNPLLPQTKQRFANSQIYVNSLLLFLICPHLISDDPAINWNLTPNYLLSICCTAARVQRPGLQATTIPLVYLNNSIHPGKTRLTSEVHGAVRACRIPSLDAVNRSCKIQSISGIPRPVSTLREETYGRRQSVGQRAVPAGECGVGVVF